MLKYRHSVKENPNDRYNWSATNTAWVSARTLKMSKTMCSVKMHQSIRDISRETGIYQLTVHGIIHRDLQLKCVKRRRAQELSKATRVAHLTRCKQLLKRYSDPAVEKTVEPPFNSQNYRVYAPVGTKERHIDLLNVKHALNIQHIGYGVRSTPLPCQKWIWLNLCLSTIGWRWTASITAMSCSLSSCFQQSNVLHVKRLSFNNTAFRHIAPAATPSSCCCGRHPTSSVL